MTETEIRQFLTKYLGNAGYDVQRNESGALNEGFPDLTIAKDKKSILLELKQGSYSKGVVKVAKYRPRQKGKLITLSFAHTVRLLVVTPEKMAYLLSAAYMKFNDEARAIRWKGVLDKDCDFAQYLNRFWEDLK